MNNDDLEDEIDLYYNKWLAAKQRAERLESGPGGIMEMKQTIADKEKRIDALETAIKEALNNQEGDLDFVLWRLNKALAGEVK